MAQYLLAMLARDPTGRRAEPFSDLFGQGGRWGDYVFDQEGLFFIILPLNYSFLDSPQLSIRS